MLYFDLAERYAIENKALKQSVKRNRDRFPADGNIKFQLKNCFKRFFKFAFILVVMKTVKPNKEAEEKDWTTPGNAYAGRI